jgi:hypothetical protein
MTTAIRLPEAAALLPLQYGFCDDFQGFLTATSTDKYTVVTAVDGSVLQIDAAPGGVAIKSAVASASGDEDCYLAREAETFLPAAGKPITFGALVQATEDDTNQNNLIVGMANAVAADLLVSAGAGPKTSGTMIGFYKVDGGLNWWILASLGSTQTKVELTAANSLDKVAHVGSGSAKQLLQWDFIPKTSTLADIIYKIDGVAVYKITDWVFTSATDMQAVCGCKDGDAGDEVTINLYGWYAYQGR